MIKTLSIAITLLVALNLQAASKIYKYTDENGKLHYTDKKPAKDAQEAKIKSLSVVKSADPKPTSTRRRTEHKKNQASALFPNFVITSPKPESSLWGTGGNVIITVDVGEKLPSNYRIKFYLDGIAHGKVKSNTQMISDVVRGEHNVYAEVLNANSRTVIKTTPSVKFYLKQHSKK